MMDARAASVAFGQRLHQLRAEHGVSKDELARRTGLHNTAIRRYERGAREPRLSAIERLARGLDLPPRALVEDAPRESSEPPIPKGELDIWSPYDRKRLLKAGADLTDAEDFYYFAAERVAHDEALVSAVPPERRHLEMLRLRLIEGLTLREVGEQTGVTGTTVMHLLSHYFGVRGVPPAAKARRRKK